MIPEFNVQPIKWLHSGEKKIPSFLASEENIDSSTVESFGEEWQKFNSFDAQDLENSGNEYFDIVSEKMLNSKSIVLDAGCGSGRWSYFIADRVKAIHAIDPSSSVMTAAQLLSTKKNVQVSQASIDHLPFENASFDFILCLGVLHHIPDTQSALNNLVTKLKPGGYALLYFYYNLENRGGLYKLIFSIVNGVRKIISKMPKSLKHFLCDAIALLVYLPLVLVARFLKAIHPKGKLWKRIPLSYYTNKSFRIMRNDALDRFGTSLEKRYSKAEISSMMEKAGLSEIAFSENQPYWHCVGRKI